jgi:hypothetical protein
MIGAGAGGLTLPVLLTYILGVYGISWIITRSQLVKPLREKLDPKTFLGELVRCIVCTGTWVGMGVAFLSRWTCLGSLVSSPLDIPLWGGVAAACCWLIGGLRGDAE